MQSSVNPNVLINGTATQWEPTSTLYPIQATTVDRAKMWMCKPYHTNIEHPLPLIIMTFESYLSTLDKWGALLLQDMVLHQSIYEISQFCHRDTERIIIARDGSSSEEDNLMTFGWRIVNSEEDILAEHAGPAFVQATSFCAEGYGLLSVAWFLYLISQYTTQDVWCKIDIYIDNKGMVTQIKDQLKCSHNYLFNTLEPDWDIVAQSAHTLWIYGSNLIITHAKSHQDDDILMDNLHLPARLNVAAD
eukprot:4910964-Ditylum_brightwellii.AAC.1